jgi:ABC-type dipeptide/oligopeptide/nickel transport system permease component
MDCQPEKNRGRTDYPTAQGIVIFVVTRFVRVIFPKDLLFVWLDLRTQVI